MDSMLARRTWSRAWLMALLLFLFANGAAADEVSDVKALLKAGKLTEALVKADKALQEQQHNPSMQFVKGLILSEQKNTAEAIAIFSKLTVDYPNYPEPYNNLAVLFATEGQYSKARIALETALKINPHYVTAQENMGDVFLQSAMRAYTEAAQSDSENPGLRQKLRAVRHTLGLPLADAGGSQGKPSSASVIGPALPTAAGASTSNGLGGAEAEREAVLRVVDQWIKAWSAKDTKSYFSVYADDFKTPHAQTREQWQKQRLSRINNKQQIDVQMLSASVTIQDKVAIVNFQQVYVAGKISSNARKSLTLKNEGGNWKIFQEKSDG